MSSSNWALVLMSMTAILIDFGGVCLRVLWRCLFVCGWKGGGL